jgi:hypothetical protein
MEAEHRHYLMTRGLEMWPIGGGRSPY